MIAKEVVDRLVKDYYEHSGTPPGYNELMP